MSDRVFVGLGSNLGDREANLCSATDALRRIDAVALCACSSLYDSAPVGPPQPRYLNAVAELSCDLPPLRLLGILKAIERELGRQKTERWQPRVIDLDILLWDGKVIAEASLQVPHLELHKRRFAVEPLVELAPDVRHPLLGRTARQMLAPLRAQDVVRLDSPGWFGRLPTGTDEC